MDRQTNRQTDIHLGTVECTTPYSVNSAKIGQQRKVVYLLNHPVDGLLHRVDTVYNIMFGTCTVIHMTTGFIGSQQAKL